MHLADAFIQSDLHGIQVTVFTFLSALAFPGNRTHDLGVASAMLYYLSYRKAVATQKNNNTYNYFLDILFLLLPKPSLFILMKNEHSTHNKCLFLSGVAELYPEERWPGFHWAYQRGKVKSHVCSSNTITSSHITVANVTLNWLSGAQPLGRGVTMASLRQTREQGGNQISR